MTLFREVLDRQRSAAAVASSITAHGAAAGESLASRFEGVLRKGERAPDVALALALFGRLLTRDAETLAAAGDRHEAEKSDDDAPRAARDESATADGNACVVARDGVAAVFGDAALAPLGLADPAPPVGDGPALARYADRAAAKPAEPENPADPAASTG